MQLIMGENLKTEAKTYNTVFEVVVDIHSGGMDGENGNLEDFIRAIAIGCNLAGITLAEAKRLIAEKFNTEESVVSATVYAVYREYINDYAAESLSYNQKLRANDDEEVWLKMPYLPDDVFRQLPPILQSAVSVFSDDKRERDVFFTGVLTVLSGIFPWVYGTYKGRTVYPNLFCFVVAPAGSGKGSMVFAKELGMRLHRIDNDKQLFIPANISAAALYQELAINEGIGILFETEADTMTASFRQEWGNFSDSLRKAFQHESISSQRRGTEGGRRSHIEIQTPKLSVALSGTKKQVNGIIQNTEDGLFSRFLFYTFRSEPVWKNSTSNDTSLDDFFKNLSAEIPKIVNNLRSIEKFDFMETQWQIFDARFSTWLDEFDSSYPDESLSIIKRMGLITFRIAMILSLMRKGSEDNNNENDNGNENEAILYCKYVDFHLAFYLIETYVHHSLYMFEFLNGGGIKQSVVGRKLHLFFDTLPSDEFSRAKAVQIGKEEVNLEERTVDKYLKKLMAFGDLIQENYGKYKKRYLIVTVQSVESIEARFVRFLYFARLLT